MVPGAELAGNRDYGTVCWSDECTLEIGEDQRTIWMTRGPGREQEYAKQNLKPIFKSGSEFISIWGCFCGDKIRLIYVLPKGQNMNLKRYKYVLQRLFIPFYNRMREKYGN